MSSALQQSPKFALYHHRACPYCAKVVSRLDLNKIGVELRDIRKDPIHAKALIKGGGKQQVPCLRIALEGGDAQWLYESDEIIRYLSRASKGNAA